MTSPLNKADITNLQKLIARLRDYQQEIDAAKAAGLPCDEHCERHSHLLGAAEQLLSTYKPLLQK